MENQRLQYYMHDEPDAFRLELVGSLSGEGAAGVYHAWRMALSLVCDRRLIADITCVTEADERGRDRILLGHRHGVRIAATSAESCALEKSILGEQFVAPAPAP